MVYLSNEIQRTRTIFKYAVDNTLVKSPIKFGSEFKRPNKKTMRRHRAKTKPEDKLFTPDEILRLIGAANVQMRAMLWLGINCAMGNSDCGNLTMLFLDLGSGWHSFPRPKTGVVRLCPLWAETVDALEQAIAVRPEPKHEADVDNVFITKQGLSYHKDMPDNPISKEMAKLMKSFNLHKPGRSLYALRQTFATEARAVNDDTALRVVMGHADDNILDEHYTHRFPKERLLAVTDHVRAWMFGEKETE